MNFVSNRWNILPCIRLCVCLRVNYSSGTIISLYMYLSSDVEVAGLVLGEDGEELSDTGVEIIGHLFLGN